MKVKIILSTLIIYLTFALSTKAQEGNEKNKETKQLPTYNIYNDPNYTLTGEKLDYFKVKFTIKKLPNDSDTKEFTINFMTYENFIMHFKKSVSDLEIINLNTTVTVDDEANRLYYLFVAGIQTLEINKEGPVAGKLKFNESIEITKIDDRLHPYVQVYLQNMKKIKGKVKKNGVVLKKKDEGNENPNNTNETKDNTLGKDKQVNTNKADEKKKVLGDSNQKQKTDNATLNGERIENLNNTNNATYVGWAIFGRNPISLKRKFPYRKRHFLLPQEIEQNNNTWLTKKEADKSILDSKINEIDNQTKELAFNTWREYQIKKNEKENLDKKKSELDILIIKETFDIDSLNIVIENKKESLNKVIIDSISFFSDHSFIEGMLRNHFKDIKYESKNADEKTYRTLLGKEILKKLDEFYKNETIKLNGVKFDSVTVLKYIDKHNEELLTWQDSIKGFNADKNAYYNIKKDSIENLIKLNEGLLVQFRNQKLALDLNKLELVWFSKNIETIASLLSESYSLIKDIERLNMEKSKKESNLSNLKNENTITITNSQEKQNILDSLVKEYNKKLEELVKPNFKIEMAEIEFNNGFIENIRVKGKINPIYSLKNDDPNKDKILSPTLYFENLYPIGFSRESDYDYLYKTFLFANSTIKTVFNRNESVNYKLRLSDAITYDYKHEVNRRDYSPKNEIIKYDTTSIENPKVLHKLETAKLFELKVYSDFMGFNESSPNGLIQSELEKEIPILTRRYPLIYAWRSNWGFLSYVVPNLVISKIEDQNKHLPISYYPLTVGNTSIPIKYASTLDLFKYESFNTGIDINFFTYDILNAKSAIHINGGLKYGITPIIDSTRSFSNEIVTKTGFATTDNINSFRIYPKVAIIIQPEERYSMTLSFTHNWYWARTNSFMQVGNTEKFQNSGEQQQKSNQFNTGELSANFNVNENNNNSGKLFFRYRFNWQQGYWNTGFSQIQFGYSFFLIRKL